MSSNIQCCTGRKAGHFRGSGQTSGKSGTLVILSGLAYPGSFPGRIMQAWRAGASDVLLSEYILDERRRVLPRLAHRHGLSESEIDDLVDILAFQADIVTPKTVAEDVVRDAADQAILGTFLVATETCNADYLNSGDKDLLVLSASYPVISPAEFWRRHGMRKSSRGPAQDETTLLH